MTNFSAEFYDGFEAIIFDMDGLLIDSEPLWWRSEMEILQAVGVPLTEKMCLETMGTRVDEMVAHWYARFPWSGPGIEETAESIVELVGRLIRAEGVAMPGTVELIGRLNEQNRVMAVASSSPASLIDAVLATLDLEDAFTALYTAADEVAGKPDPAVYLSAARGLNVNPSRCLVFEDSTAGIIAGKGAGMTVVAVSPESRGVDTSMADLRLDSLLDCLPG